MITAQQMHCTINWQVRGADNSIDSLFEQVGVFSTTLAELQYDEVDTSLLVETQINMNHVR